MKTKVVAGNETAKAVTATLKRKHAVKRPMGKADECFLKRFLDKLFET